MLKNFRKSSSIAFIFAFGMLTSISNQTFADTKSNDLFQYKITAIPPDYKILMEKYTWHPGCPVPLENLAYINLSYWGFDRKTHTGTLIVNKKLAREVVTIFHELYKDQFPIERMDPMDVFKGRENVAMIANDTSAFDCRKNDDTDNFSLHSFGYAIDINRLLNPYVKGNQVLPVNGTAYLNRAKPVPGMIVQGDKVYQVFSKHGWAWGGSGKNVQDYQHFVKDCSKPETCR